MADEQQQSALERAGLQKDPKKVTRDEWQKILTPEQYHVAREQGTERAFTGVYDKHKDDGTYLCTCCGAELFDSTSKFNSGCGWPAFAAAKKGEDQADGTEAETTNVLRREDHSFGRERVEVICKQCNAHLGHVFDDGPKHMTGERFCINSVSLGFKPKK